MSDEYKTSYSLLERALDLKDETAWVTLIERYSVFIDYLLRQLQVREEDVSDVSQEVMLNLTKNLEKFDKTKGRFRPWFSSVIRNTVKVHFRKLNSNARKSEKFQHEYEFMNSDDSELDQRISAEWQDFLTEQALNNIRGNFRGQAITVFELSLQGVPNNEIHQRTGVGENSIYKLKQRVKRAMVIEIKSLLKELEPGS